MNLGVDRDVLGRQGEKGTEPALAKLELFFPDELHAAGIRLFAACEHENIASLAALKGKALSTEAEALAERIFSNHHAIYAMLFDLQGLDVVRIIEGRE